MCADLGVVDCVDFVRVAVTPPQIAQYGLPEMPAKATDRRGEWRGRTVQAEAFAPHQLANEVRDAIEAHIDREALVRICAAEHAERADLLALVDRALATEGEANA